MEGNLHLKRVPKASIKYWKITESFNLIGFMVGGGILLYFIRNIEWLFNIGVLTLIIIVCTGILDIFVHPYFRYKHCGYGIYQDRIEYSKGIYVKHHTVIPLARVQHLTLVNGPLLKKFNLANVEVYTAQGSHSLRTLPIFEAQEIVDTLATRVDVVVRAELEKES